MGKKKKIKLQLPHVYTLAFVLIIAFAILTWILPSGQFDRQLVETAAGEREVAVAGIHGNPQLVYRYIWWVLMMTVTIIYVMRYAMKVKKNPTVSITYQDDILKKQEFIMDDKDTGFTLRDKLVLFVFALGMGIIVYGILAHSWYMDEIAGVFLAMGILMGIVGGFSEKEIAEQFVIGVKDLAFAALASLTMPIMAPLCDLRGVNPEAGVTVLQFSNQLTNMLSPTAGMTVAGLAVCKITFGQWWKTIWKFFILVTAMALAFCTISAML